MIDYECYVKAHYPASHSSMLRFSCSDRDAHVGSSKAGAHEAPCQVSCIEEQHTWEERGGGGVLFALPCGLLKS